jgi:hypothetical protein
MAEMALQRQPPGRRRSPSRPALGLSRSMAATALRRPPACPVCLRVFLGWRTLVPLTALSRPPASLPPLRAVLGRWSAAMAEMALQRPPACQRRLRPVLGRSKMAAAMAPQRHPLGGCRFPSRPLPGRSRTVAATAQQPLASPFRLRAVAGRWGAVPAAIGLHLTTRLRTFPAPVGLQPATRLPPTAATVGILPARGVSGSRPNLMMVMQATYCRT